MDRFVNLCKKEVIDIIDGRRLGCVCDLEIDECSGKILAIIVPGRHCGIFARREDFIIPWHHIKKIGDDIILVNLNLRCPT
ncbi:MAG: YlmC/YmxH family sporulation protein [Oscillospiraceae bacterium]|nr:YlmC/YmxH family sporulation protein [Oscillospiraceae bacterium]